MRLSLHYTKTQTERKAYLGETRQVSASGKQKVLGVSRAGIVGHKNLIMIELYYHGPFKTTEENLRWFETLVDVS